MLLRQYFFALLIGALFFADCWGMNPVTVGGLQIQHSSFTCPIEQIENKLNTSLALDTKDRELIRLIYQKKQMLLTTEQFDSLRNIRDRNGGGYVRGVLAEHMKDCSFTVEQREDAASFFTSLYQSASSSINIFATIAGFSIVLLNQLYKTYKPCRDYIGRILSSSMISVYTKNQGLIEYCGIAMIVCGVLLPVTSCLYEQLVFQKKTYTFGEFFDENGDV